MEESRGKIDSIKDRYRELLSNLTGVFASNVDIAEDGSIREIHILGSQSRNPKQIARDVQSALASAFDIRIDHRIISIAQIPSDPIFKQEQDEYNAAGPKTRGCVFWSTASGKACRTASIPSRSPFASAIRSTRVRRPAAIPSRSGCARRPSPRWKPCTATSAPTMCSFCSPWSEMQIAGTRVALTAIECSGPDTSSMLVGSAVYNSRRNAHRHPRDPVRHKQEVDLYGTRNELKTGLYVPDSIAKRK